MNPANGKARNLINRFPFTDLSIAISLQGEKREFFLRRFVETSTARSYKWVRDASCSIYCVELPLFKPYTLTWNEIEALLRKITPQHNIEANVEAERELFDLVRPRHYKAFPLDPNVLRIGHNQIVYIGLNFYLVDGDRLVFQYPQPRAQPIFDQSVITAMASIIFHAYAFGDYAQAEVEIADLSAEYRNSPRNGRIRLVGRNEMMSRDQLTKDVEEVYGILRSLVDPKP